MKKTIYQLGMVVAIALAFTACTQKEETSITPANEKHYATITLGKDVETKTAVVEGTTSATYKWCEDDAQYLHVYENGTEGEITDFELNNDRTVATLTVAFSGSATKYTYKAAYGKEVTDKGMPILQAEQYPTTESFDPAADILVSREIKLEAAATTISFTMGRPATINKLTLSGLGEGEIVSSVALTMDKNMVGTLKYSSNAYTFSNGGNRLTMKYDASTGIISGTSFPVYFVSAPVEEASIVSVVVVTDKKVYVKSNSLDPNPFEGKPTLTFAPGNMTRFAMSMSGFGAAGTLYTLVQSEDQIFSGATYLIGAEGYVMGDDGKNRTSNIGAITALEGDGSIMITASMPAYTFTIEAVDDGYTIQDDASSQYLYASSTTNNYLKETSDATDNKTVWTISIEDGVASINNVGNTTRGQMRFNSNNGSPLFACYASDSSTGTAELALYIDESTAVEPTDPELAFSPASVSVSWDDKDEFEHPTLTKPEGISVTWASSEESVATIDEESGEITFVGNGTTTITASSRKTKIGDVIYMASSASYELTVSGKPAEKGESAENPFSASEAVAFIQSLGDEVPTTAEYYITGTVTSVDSQFSTTYGNATFFISDDGLATSTQFQAYRVLYLGNRKWQTGDQTIGVGDEVIVCGRLTKHVSSTTSAVTYETYATTGNSAYNGYLVSLEKAPYFTAALSASSIGYDGGDLTLTIAANTAWTVSIDGEATLQIGTAAASASVSGDNSAEVTVHIPANTSSAEVTYSITMAPTGVTAPEALTITQAAHGDDPKGSETNPYTASEARAQAIAGNTSEVYVIGIVTAITTPYSSQFNNVTFTITDDGVSGSDVFTVFRAAAESADTYKIGDWVKFKGTLTYYNNTTPEFTQGPTLISQIHAPTFTPNGGNFTGNSQSITLSADSGAEIRYTTGSTLPTATTGTVYSGAIVITETTTINAIAILDGNATGVVSKTFTKGDTSWNLVSSLSDIVEGTYAIAAFSNDKYYTVPNTTIDGQTFTCTEADYSATNGLTLPTGAGEFTFTPVSGVDNAFYIYNTTLNKYLVATGSKKFGYVTSSSDDYGYWTFSTVSSGGFSGVFSVQHSNKSHYLRAYSNSVKCYDSATNQGVYLFINN